MYNGIGLQTARGSGTNGYVTRNLSAVRKTKEKVPEYKEKEDAAVRPYDPELIEHERRRQAEVRCMELRELLEEQNISEDEIEEKVSAFRAKLLAEKKMSLAKDSSGRTMVKDSHELSMAQENKNDRAKDAFGIRSDFVPGSSFEAKQPVEKPAAATSTKDVVEPSVDTKSSAKHEDKDRSRKRKKSKKSSRRSSSSSSSSISSSDEDSKRKKRRKEKKKKSKKSHHHRKEDEDSPNARSSSSSSCSEESHKSHSHNEQSDGNGEIVAKYSVAILDIPSHGEVCANAIDLSARSHSHSPVDIIESTLIPVLQASTEYSSIQDTPKSRKSSRSPHSVRSSRSNSPASVSSRQQSRSRSPSVKSAHSSHSGSSRSTAYRSKSPSVSSSRSRSKSRSRSHSKSTSGSNSSSGSSSSDSSKSARSIPRRRGSPSFLDRRRITSARKRPIPYKKRNGAEWDVSSSSSDSS